MTIECTLCPGKRCTFTTAGRIIDHAPYALVKKPEQFTLSEVKIDNCEWRETQEWFMVEGKVDELNLGC
jgi:hypothetical protein